MRCPHCRVDLHVCHMCRSFDKRYIGHCSHDEADRVMDKESANYCTFFSPNPAAHMGLRDDPAARARSELDALFGSGEPEDRSGEYAGDTAVSPQERALRDAESLFHLGSDKDGKN